MAIDRPRLGLAVDADVGDLGQPPGRGLVQVLQAAEGPAAKQAGFDISKWPLDLPFRLGPPGSAGHRAEAVVGRERQEPRVVDRLVAVVAADHDFHVVIEAFAATPPRCSKARMCSRTVVAKSCDSTKWRYCRRE